MMSSVINLAREPIQKLVPYSSARQESMQQGTHLDANENPFWREDGFNRYPNPQPELLRQMLAELYSVKSSQLMITRGSDEGIDLLIRTFCESNKDAIVITPPTYGMYEVAANIQGARVVKIHLDGNMGFTLDKDSILSRWDSTMKLIFLCSPNNPIGNVLPVDEIIALCENLQNKALVILDEAYIEFSTTESLSGLISQFPNLVVLRTLSKAFGLAGIRLGSLIADEPVIALLMKVIAPYPIPIPVERIAINALAADNQVIIHSQIQIIQSAREKLKTFLEGLSSVDYVYPSQANFLLVKVKDSEKWMKICQKNQIIIRSRAQIPGLENCVRITIGTYEEIECLKEVLSYV